jgi:NADH dehydrogenase
VTHPTPADPLKITVTSANSSTGQRLLPRLAAIPAQVTALVRSPIDLPAARVVADWTTSPEALEAIRAADVVIHLSGVFAGPDWQTHYDGTVATAEHLAKATRAGQRVLYLSYVDADPEAPNWYEKAKGLAEQKLNGSPAQVLILRIPPIIYGTAAPGAFERRMLPADSPGPVTVIGDGTKRFRPLYSGDIVKALVAACTTDAAGTYDLVGPENLSVNEIVYRLNGPGVTIQPLPVAAARRIPAIPDTAIELFTKPGREPDPVTAWRILGITPTPLADIWPPDRAAASH